MMAWLQGGNRLDMEISVALEVGAQRAREAGTPKEREEAAAFNLALWRSIRRLAVTAPNLEDREALVHCAGEVERSRGRDVEALCRCNRAHAMRLTGRAASDGSLKALLAEWSAFRTHRRDASFASWLLDRMDNLGAGPVSVTG